MRHSAEAIEATTLRTVANGSLGLANPLHGSSAGFGHLFYFDAPPQVIRPLPETATTSIEGLKTGQALRNAIASARGRFGR
jgi:hypothetical protein